jgi:hypothetical protein
MRGNDRARANRDAAFEAVKSDLAKLQSLTQELQIKDTAPAEWVEQSAALMAARTEFDQADRDYVNALHQRS